MKSALPKQGTIYVMTDVKGNERKLKRWKLITISPTPYYGRHTHTSKRVRLFFDRENVHACTGVFTVPLTTRQSTRRYNISNDEALSSSSVAAGNSPLIRPPVVRLYVAVDLCLHFLVYSHHADCNLFPLSWLYVRCCRHDTAPYFRSKSSQWWDGKGSKK